VNFEKIIFIFLLKNIIKINEIIYLQYINQKFLLIEFQLKHFYEKFDKRNNIFLAINNF